MLRPQRVELMIDEILSSFKTTVAAALATWTPDPMQKPTSEILRASTSFMPSPVTATVLSISLSPLAIKYLSSGVALAITLSPF